MRNVTIPEPKQVWQSTKFSTEFVRVVSVNDVEVRYTIHGDEYKNPIEYFQTHYLYSHTSK
jgi:hypothetical protein